MLHNWRDAILQHFVPQVSQLTLVADPDDLLTEELLAVELRTRGFDVLDFDDPVAFRYVYETNYRARWDRGEQTDLMVIVRVPNAAFDRLPYDLLTRGRKLAFDLGALFPTLSYPVLQRLDRKHLDAVFAAQQIYAPTRMGELASQDFLLRHVFGITPELITTDVALLRCLLRCHYNRLDIPGNLTQRFIQILYHQHDFQRWPLEQIVPDNDAFFAFLQERWPRYLATLRTNLPPESHTTVELSGNHCHCEESSTKQSSETNKIASQSLAMTCSCSQNITDLGTDDHLIQEQTVIPYNFKYAGSDLLPFGHREIGVYLDNLFLENRLTPVNIPVIPPADAPWVKTGITYDPQAQIVQRASRLSAVLQSSLPQQDARYSDWFAYAIKWAELSALVHQHEAVLPDGAFTSLSAVITTAFTGWLYQHYASLINLPPVQPVMVHHIPRYLARVMETSPDSRMALIVIDGLALDQWISIRQILAEQDRSLLMHESAVFAWIPTLTSVSRQAIFAGKPPIYFAASIGSTEKEPELWRQFWENVGVSRSAIAYQKGLGDGKIEELLETVFHPGQTRMLGLVVDKVDKILHGMQLGSVGMQNQIRQWCERGFLVALLRYLLDHKYQVWLTSDHGNLECTGQGQISEGVLAETRGERVRIYPARELLNVQQGDAWPPIGLPNAYYPLLAQGRSAFVKQGEIIVAHGGASPEEVIVPFVKFERLL